ncbi:MAG: tetratricopeptide repeat protein [Deltaproteobacteria bacterium]|nr:tetratricopeptide repeat protein [Deltaproteobacteria bacterium]
MIAPSADNFRQIHRLPSPRRPSWRSARALLFALLCTSVPVLSTLSASPARAAGAAEAVADRIAQGNALLNDWQLDEAAAIAAELDGQLPDVPPVQALLGAVKFHQGDFDSAVRLLRRAAEAGEAPALLPLAESTLEETRGALSKESAHFIVRVPAGKDEVLFPIALQALEQAFERITAAFDYVPRHKIAVDVLHDARGLAHVSSLTEKEIETSGTIALCKYNRLMVTSPKALARGYSWLDTLAHELLHLIISEKSRNTVPVWLHEGLAKYNETRWRGAPGLALDAASENLLARGTKTGKLITFEQMHPSMAKLPSQDDTALAFAEVFTVIEFVEKTIPEKDGKRATNILLETLANDATMDEALRASTGRDLAGLQRDWRQYLGKRAFKLVPGAEPKRLTFVKDARGAGPAVDEAEEEAALKEATERGAAGKKHVRLGNLLRERRRLKAAAVEYERAAKITGVTSPALHNRLAGVLLQTGDVLRARQWLDKTVAVFPDDPQTRVLLGRLAVRDQRWDEAQKQYERATWENPFIPEVHVALLAVADKTGDAALKTRAEDALRALAGHAARQVDDPLFVMADAPAGALSLRSEPWGRVFVDGVDTGRFTPVIDVRIAAGRHVVRVEDPVSGRAASATVDIAASRTRAVQLVLQAVTEDERRALLAAEAALRPPPPPPPVVDAGVTAPPEGDDDKPVPPWLLPDDGYGAEARPP